MVPNGHLMFEDVSFLDSTVAKMNALRKSGQFCDVRMQVCGRELMAHRAVLACCSPFLFELFNSECEPPGGISLVRFDDLHPVAMEILLNYAYTAQLKADKNLVREVYSAARKLKMERVRQVCGDYLLTKMDSQSAISYRKFASSMADTRILAQVDAYIQEHLLDVANHEDFLKLPRLKLEVLLEDSLVLPGNGRLYSKVIDWLQRCLWENGQPMESLMEQVQTLYYSADHRLHQDHSPTLVTAQEGVQRQTSLGSAPSASGQLCKYEWKYIASEKTTNSTYLCLAVLNGMLCVIMLHGRSSPQTSPSTTPSGTPSLSRSLSLEAPPSEEAEHVLQPMHYARSGLGTASLGGKLIAAGGYNREECLRTVERYDPQTDRWSFLSPMRTPRARFQMAVLRGQLYVMGGSNGQSDELSCGETYDPLADEWTPVPELRTNRCNAGVCALKGRLYVVGGSDPCGQTGLKNCDSFDPETKTWSTCAPLNTRRQQGAVCALDGFMYVIGGAESWLSNCLSSVERYDPDLDCWTPLAPMNLARRGAGLAVHQGWLVVVGGFDGSHALSSVEAYDPAADEWKMLGAMTTARSNAGVAVLGDVVCAVGGFDGNDFLNTMEVYELENNEWSPCAHAFSATPTLSL